MSRRWVVFAVSVVASALTSSLPHRSAPGPRRGVEQIKQDAIRQLKAMPIAFEENVGQTAETASFVARGQGYTVWATSTGPVLRLREAPASTTGATVRLRVVDGTLGSQPSGESLLPGRANYFLGNDPARWKTRVSRFAALRYGRVYPGVDLVLHGSQESLEYDFVVAPYADPSRIAVSFDGATAVRIEPDGDLTLAADEAELNFHPPVAYQTRGETREIVPARYDVDDNVVRFALGEYDHSRPLVIDPVLSYSTYLGGQKNAANLNFPADRAFALAVDTMGNAYLAGYTAAVDFPMAGTPFDTTCGGCFNSGVDAFVAKIDPTLSGAASLVFSTYLGAASLGSTLAYGVAVDGSQNVYVTGWTTGSGVNGFPTLNAFQPNAGGGGSDGFLTKLSATGSSLLYSTYIGGNNTDEGSDVKADNSGNAVVVGKAASTAATFLEIKNGYQATNQGGFDVFVAKFDTMQSGAASLKYGTFLGGSSTDQGGSVALGGGLIYVTGDTQSTATLTKFPTTPNGFQTTGGGGTDAFMAIIDPSVIGTSSLLYSTFIGGDGTETSTSTQNGHYGGIAVDPAGMVYVTGSTSGSVSKPFPITPGAYRSTLVSSEAFVVKIDPTISGASSLVASTFLGGSVADDGTGVAIDSAGNPVVSGYTGSTDFPFTTCGAQKLQVNNIDAFVVVFNQTLTNVTVATTLGAAGADRAYGVGIGPLGQIYLAGETDSQNFPVTMNAFDQTHQSQCNGCGSYDAFLTVIPTPLACPIPPVATGFSTTVLQNTPTQLSLTATDTGGNSNPPETLTWIVIGGGPAHGQLDATSGTMSHGAGVNYSAPITYTPASNFFGADSFQFRVNDGGLNSNIATVSITVNAPPTANPQSVATAEETQKAITLTGSDPENALLQYAITSLPSHGQLTGSGPSWNYLPDVNYFGPDGFTFSVTDPPGATSAAVVSITVTNVNDAPTTTPDGATTQEDTPVTVNVLGNDTDADNDPLSVTQISCGVGALAVINPDKTVTVTPPLNFNGVLACGYTVSDGNGGTANGQLSITVNAVNDAPTTTPDGATTLEDTPVTVNVLANDTDVDNDPLSVTQISCGVGVLAVINPDNTVTVTPPLNFNGTLTCGYTVSDGHGGTATGQLSVGVTAVNDAPIAAPDLAATDDNTLIVVAVLANDSDPDNDKISLDPTVTCQHGKAAPNPDGTVTYTPPAGFDGIDQCTYTISDPFGATASGLVTVAVTKVNDPPTLTNPGNQQTMEGGAVSVQLNANDPDGDALTFSSTGLPPGVTIDANGLISGAPDAGSAGSYPVTITVTDGQGLGKTVEFVWVVAPPVSLNRAPSCTDAQPSVSVLWPPSHQLVPISIVGVSDPDGDQLAITITRILQDEPTNTSGDANTWIDGFGVGTSTGLVRAERTGTPKEPGDGRVYQIFFSAADVYGATCTGSVLVGVPHDQSGAPAIDSIIRYDSTVKGGQPVKP